MPKLYQLHPAAVHFPVALLATGAAVAAARLRKFSPHWFSLAESWLLWLGTFAAWTALGFGLLAERFAPHKPLAWEVLADHKTLAWWTCGVFTLLSAVRYFATDRGLDVGRWRAAQLFLWIAGCALLVSVARHGGELVYDFGMGLTP